MADNSTGTETDHQMQPGSVLSSLPLETQGEGLLEEEGDNDGGSKDEPSKPADPDVDTGETWYNRSEAWFQARREKALVVDWKEVDFEHFKNRYSPSDGLEIIEVLRGHHHLGQEIWKETQGRIEQDMIRRRTKTWTRRMKSYSGDNEAPYIQRIRIQSPAILLLLSRISGHQDTWSINKPRVFFRPFRSHYYYLPQMKEVLSILEKRWGHESVVAGATDISGEDKETDFDQANGGDGLSDDLEDPRKVEIEDVVDGETANSETAMHHVRKYIEFVEKNIVPIWETAQGINKRKVAFLDLWMSFKPGEILYRPHATDSSQSPEKAKPVNNTAQKAWRLYTITMETYEDDVPNDIQMTSGRDIALHCYYIDYTGTSYQPVTEKFRIPDYAGEKDITQLSIYPLRFAKDAKRLMRSLQEQGERFHFAKTQKYMYFDGWTLTQGPTGTLSSSDVSRSEHIDSHVIVDFAEGYKADASLDAPSSEGLEAFSNNDWITGDDNLEIRCWGDHSRSEELGTIAEVTQRNEWFGNYLRIRHMKENKFMRAWRSGDVTELDSDSLALLPRRAVAYAFRERKFILADIDSLQEIKKRGDVFRDLKIDPNHKNMIESLVRTHFQKQTLQKEYGGVNLNQDLIRGKGSGLVLLLHGVPGVGKTATAEAIAEINSKPLFTITCGDLGFDPRNIDDSLREIFRLAHLWDCVLLLDEADVFLSRREINDLKRNALVSVFLRVLEYYSGILFLTTNRVGHLDEAFKSRIHISLYYPPLSRDQTLAIFEVNIRQLLKIEDEKQDLMNREVPVMKKRPKMIIDENSLLQYASWHWQVHHPSERWNGRQIRNAFQIAYSLAHWQDKNSVANSQGRGTAGRQGRVVAQALSSSPQLPRTTGTTATATTADSQGRPQTPTNVQLKLDYTHFEDVAKVIEKFDSYLQDTTAGTSADGARDAGTRADEHDPNSVRRRRFVNPSSYGPPQQQQGPNGAMRRRAPPREYPRFTPQQAGSSGLNDAYGNVEYDDGGGAGGASGKRQPQHKPSPQPRFQPGSLAAPRGGGNGGRGGGQPRQQGTRGKPQPSTPSRSEPRGKANRSNLAGGATGTWSEESGFQEDGGWDLDPEPLADEEDWYHHQDDGLRGSADMGDGEDYDHQEEMMGDETERYDELGHHEEHVDGEQYDDGYRY